MGFLAAVAAKHRGPLAAVALPNGRNRATIDHPTDKQRTPKMAEYEFLKVEREGPLTIVTINRPEVYNLSLIHI